jgi:hypothetical protein
LILSNITSSYCTKTKPLKPNKERKTEREEGKVAIVAVLADGGRGEGLEPISRTAKTGSFFIQLK